MIHVPAPGAQLRMVFQKTQAQQPILLFIGIDNLYSASPAANHFQALILSGFHLAASAYGLPDIGFIGWGDLTIAGHGASEQALHQLAIDDPPLRDALAASRDLFHCHALLQANLRRAGEA
jgi:hypothetical protein